MDWVKSSYQFFIWKNKQIRVWVNKPSHFGAACSISIFVKSPLIKIMAPMINSATNRYTIMPIPSKPPPPKIAKQIPINQETKGFNPIMTIIPHTISFLLFV